MTGRAEGSESRVRSASCDASRTLPGFTCLAGLHLKLKIKICREPVTSWSQDRDSKRRRARAQLDPRPWLGPGSDLGSGDWSNHCPATRQPRRSRRANKPYVTLMVSCWPGSESQKGPNSGPSAGRGQSQTVKGSESKTPPTRPEALSRRPGIRLLATARINLWPPSVEIDSYIRTFNLSSHGSMSVCRVHCGHRTDIAKCGGRMYL